MFVMRIKLKTKEKKNEEEIDTQSEKERLRPGSHYRPILKLADFKTSAKIKLQDRK